MNQVLQPRRSQVAALCAFFRSAGSAGMYYCVLGALALVCLNAGMLWGRAVPDPSPPSPQEAARIAEAVRVDRAPRLDGALNDSLWQSGSPITDFHSESLSAPSKRGARSTR